MAIIQNAASLQPIAESVAQSYIADTTHKPVELLVKAMKEHRLGEEYAEALTYRTNAALYLATLQNARTPGTPIANIDTLFPVISQEELLACLKNEMCDGTDSDKATSSESPASRASDADTTTSEKADDEDDAKSASGDFAPRSSKQALCSLPQSRATLLRVADDYVHALSAYAEHGYDPSVIHKAATLEAGTSNDLVQELIQLRYKQATGQDLRLTLTPISELMLDGMRKKADSAWDLDIDPDVMRAKGSWLLPVLAASGTATLGIAGLTTLLAKLTSGAESIGESLATY